MAQFENQQDDVLQLQKAIAAKLVILEIDWQDPVQRAELAREALAFTAEKAHQPMTHSGERSKFELFGLINLMLKTLQEGAEDGERITRDEMWCALEQALWAAKK